MAKVTSDELAALQEDLEDEMGGSRLKKDSGAFKYSAALQEDSEDEMGGSRLKKDSGASHLLPSSRSFRIFKYRNPRTARQKQLFKCDYSGCKRTFAKLHNFLDHLRVHTG